ncbi:MAG TPA: hypothetical protein VGA89_01080 [Patescibacteria group bacterium]|jgi:hypothetical protein
MAKKGNLRDYADVTQLVVLANLKSVNAELIRQGLSQSTRLVQLNQIAIVQILSLIGNSGLTQLK